MNARTVEYGVFVLAFLARLIVSLRDKRPHDHCSDAFANFLKIGATIVILYLPVCLLSILLSKLSNRIPELRWSHPWVVRVRFYMYVLAVAALPSCYLSQVLLRFWRFK
jgi:flagellar biosynthesis protein FliR